MQTYATKKKSATPAVQGNMMENISKSEMLRLSGAGAPQPMSPALREKFEPGFARTSPTSASAGATFPRRWGCRRWPRAPIF